MSAFFRDSIPTGRNSSLLRFLTGCSAQVCKFVRRFLSMGTLSKEIWGGLLNRSRDFIRQGRRFEPVCSLMKQPIYPTNLPNPAHSSLASYPAPRAGLPCKFLFRARGSYAFPVHHMKRELHVKNKGSFFVTIRRSVLDTSDESAVALTGVTWFDDEDVELKAQLVRYTTAFAFSLKVHLRGDEVMADELKDILTRTFPLGLDDRRALNGPNLPSRAPLQSRAFLPGLSPPQTSEDRRVPNHPLRNITLGPANRINRGGIFHSPPPIA
eukprot:1186598-Prorocentrum_minimum.AAC.1